MQWLRINDINWSIKFVRPNHFTLQRNDGSFSVGCCNNDTKTIYLNNNLKGVFLKKVLAHEITHAAMFSYNIYLPLDLEEYVADIIATYGEDIIILTNLIFKEIEKDRYQFY